jgi:hypothetical protein
LDALCATQPKMFNINYWLKCPTQNKKQKNKKQTKKTSILRVLQAIPCPIQSK